MTPDLEKAIKLVQDKRPEALDHALALLQGTVMKYSLKICRQREDAEDTTQEVLIRTARQLPNFENPMALSVWLYRVAKTQCAMSRRKSKFAPTSEISLDDPEGRRTISLEQLADRDKPTSEDILMRIENAERILAAIRELPESYREIVTLHDLEELDTSEIARILDASEGAIRVRLHRGRKLLKEQLQASDPKLGEIVVG